VKRFEETMFSCTWSLQQTVGPTHFSGSEVGSENCKLGVCALSYPHRFPSASCYTAADLNGCTELRSTFMQLWKCFTVSPLPSACLAMHHAQWRPQKIFMGEFLSVA